MFSLRQTIGARRIVFGVVIWGCVSVTALEGSQPVNFQSVLNSPGRSREIPESEDIYGWLVGSWELDVQHFWVDLSGRHIKGEVHAGWVLEGRAVQDVWIMPQRADRDGGGDRNSNMYGTTLRVWDAELHAWQISWINPVTGSHLDQIGHRIGNDIVQIGTSATGVTRRWMFTEITPDSFHWTGEALQQDGRTWKLEAEFRAKRMR